MKPYGGFSFVALVVLALSACGGSDGGKRNADQNPPVSSPTSSDAELTKTSVCQDKTGDGGAVELLSASIRIQDDDVLVSAELAGPIPQTGNVSVLFMLHSAGSFPYRQVAMEWVDGRAARPRYFDSELGGRPADLRASDVEEKGNAVTMTVPDSMVDDLGNGWTWGAFIVVNGEDVDGCPGLGRKPQRF